MLRPSTKFRPYCPKCKSTHIDVVAIQGWGKTDQCMTCHLCGTQKFGTENIYRLFAAQQELWEAERLAEEAERERVRKEAEAALAVVMAKKIQAPTADKCAWEPCTNTRRTSSKYCSRTCNNHNAHARDHFRKKGFMRILPESPLSAA